jgi:hypothetical protein
MQTLLHVHVVRSVQGKGKGKGKGKGMGMMGKGKGKGKVSHLVWRKLSDVRQALKADVFRYVIREREA